MNKEKSEEQRERYKANAKRKREEEKQAVINDLEEFYQQCQNISKFAVRSKVWVRLDHYESNIDLFKPNSINIIKSEQQIPKKTNKINNISISINKHSHHTTIHSYRNLNISSNFFYDISLLIVLFFYLLIDFLYSYILILYLLGYTIMDNYNRLMFVN